jgi:hypothetical protein
MIREFIHSDHEALRRRAAMIGPGYRGRREEAGPDERQHLLDSLSQDAPSYLRTDHTWIDRRAKLFEAGDFPDKGLSISAEQLTALERGFDLPVPVLIEHANSPLELGYLTDVEAEGNELFGTVALTSEANALLERSGARALSLGLSADLSQIEEVSLVAKPRVADARLFHGSIESDSVDEQPQPKPSEGNHEERIAGFIREGRLLPSQAEFAKALLSATGDIRFDGRSIPVARVFEQLVERQPSHRLFGELGREDAVDHSAHLMLPEEADFYRRYFPEISLDAIAQRKQA